MRDCRSRKTRTGTKASTERGEMMCYNCGNSRHMKRNYRNTISVGDKGIQMAKQIDNETKQAVGKVLTVIEQCTMEESRDHLITVVVVPLAQTRFLGNPLTTCINIAGQKVGNPDTECQGS